MPDPARPETEQHEHDTDPGGRADAPELTFEEAFAESDSPPDDAQETTEDDAPAAEQPEPTPATEEAPVASAESGDDGRSPVIPRPRFDKVLTERNEARQSLERLKWAKDIRPEDFRETLGALQRIHQDPLGHAMGIVDELLSNAELSPRVTSALAKRLGERPSRKTDAPSGEGEEPAPDIEITDAKGTPTGQLTYSAPQLAKWQAWQNQRLRADIAGEFKDQFKTLGEIQAERAAHTQQQQAESFASTFAPEVEKLPLFSEHREAILEKLGQYRVQTNDPAEIHAAVYRIYHEVVGPAIAKLTQAPPAETRREVLDDLNRRARSKTGVNPRSVASEAPHEPTEFDDPSLEW